MIGLLETMIGRCGCRLNIEGLLKCFRGFCSLRPSPCLCGLSRGSNATRRATQMETTLTLYLLLEVHVTVTVTIPVPVPLTQTYGGGSAESAGDPRPPHPRVAGGASKSCSPRRLGKRSAKATAHFSSLVLFLLVTVRIWLFSSYTYIHTHIHIYVLLKLPCHSLAPGEHCNSEFHRRRNFVVGTNSPLCLHCATGCLPKQSNSTKPFQQSRI